MELNSARRTNIDSQTDRQRERERARARVRDSCVWIYPKIGPRTRVPAALLLIFVTVFRAKKTPWVPHRTGGSGVGGVWYPEAASSAQAPQPRETPPVFFEVRSVFPPNLMQGQDSGPAFEIPAGFSLEIPEGFSLESLLTSSCRLRMPDCEWLARLIANDVLDAPAFCLCFPFLFFSFASCCWLAGITSDVCFVFVFFCYSHRQLRIVVGSIAPLARHCLPYLYIYVVCVCVCVCVCVYLCMYVCMYISYIACIYIQTGIHTHTHTHMYILYFIISRTYWVRLCTRTCTGMRA